MNAYLLRAGLVALAMLLFLSPTAAEAQGILGRARDAAKRGAERAVEREAERRADRAVTGAIECTLGDRECARKAEAEGREVVYVDDAGNPTQAPAEVAAPAEPTAPAEPAAPATVRPGEGAWANYDFVPGERPLFVDDFSNDRVGNFPQRLEFRGGNMEIVEWQGQRWLSDDGNGEFFINLPETLPERFTMEFGLAGHGNAMEFSFVNEAAGYDQRVEIGTWFARLRSGAIDAQGELGVQTSETPIAVRISVDGDYLKLYANERRALNVPNAKLGRSNRIYFKMNGWGAEQPRMISDIRIMAGGQPMYDALMAEGRFATQGILFDTGSDVIKPESTPTLKEIADMLKQHADLRLTIEGHTDNVGNAASNQTLSEKRAAAVVAYLTQQGIDASRLEAQGFGDTKPVADNATPEGRQQNRRVELVRL